MGIGLDELTLLFRFHLVVVDGTAECAWSRRPFRLLVPVFAVSLIPSSSGCGLSLLGKFLLRAPFSDMESVVSDADGNPVLFGSRCN